MRGFAHPAAIAVVALALAAPADAQQGRGGTQPGRAAPAAAPPPQPAPAPAPPQGEPPPAPYEKELLRLAEIMGSLAFLRSLCTAKDAPEWPRRMQALIEAEGTTAGRKER
ncbi:MAG TPA: TIGR02301 family protein, partial [Beijerinckiaceae bacterium]|nr:TIGR02301 family protein [Beijerinckiaceae bacterium]